jgi:hypothetical protein
VVWEGRSREAPPYPYPEDENVNDIKRDGVFADDDVQMRIQPRFQRNFSNGRTFWPLRFLEPTRK